MSVLKKIKIKRSTTKTRRHEGRNTTKSIMNMLVSAPFASCRNAALREAFLRAFVSSWRIFAFRFFVSKREVAA